MEGLRGREASLGLLDSSWALEDLIEDLLVSLGLGLWLVTLVFGWYP